MEDGTSGGGADPVWQALREEAKIQVEEESILGSLMYGSILSHRSFEHSVCSVLAHRLHGPSLLPCHLLDIFLSVVAADRCVRRSIRLDLQAFKDRDPSCPSYSSALLYSKGYQALESYRIAHALWGRGRKVLALVLQSRLSEVLGIDIHPAARIGEGVILDHGTGIGQTATIGNNVSLMHGVKIGNDGHSEIGDGVIIGSCAIVLGNVTIGEGARVAASSLVSSHIPPYRMAGGNPAQLIGYVALQSREEGEHSLPSQNPTALPPPRGHRA